MKSLLVLLPGLVVVAQVITSSASPAPGLDYPAPDYPEYASYPDYLDLDKRARQSVYQQLRSLIGNLRNGELRVNKRVNGLARSLVNLYNERFGKRSGLHSAYPDYFRYMDVAEDDGADNAVSEMEKGAEKRGSNKYGIISAVGRGRGKRAVAGMNNM